ncbi:MAG: MFS transporter, partial [Phycisphaeraceae bacterium]
MPTIDRHPDAGPIHPVSAFLASRIYYGWVILAIATLAAISTAPAQTFGVAPFNSAIRNELGLSHSQLTGAYMFGTLLASLPMSYIGILSDRFGLRRSKIAAVLLLAGACGVTAMASGLFTLFLAFFLLRLFGQGALSMLSGNTLAFWFERRLGTVEGFRHLGMAGAIAVVPAMNLWLLEAVGWRSAYLIVGCAILIV